MSNNNCLVQQYRQSRKDQDDYRLTNTISAAADIILTLAAESPEPKQAESAWELVEALIRQYTEGRSHDNR